MHAILDALKNPWRQIVAVDAAIMLGLFLYKMLYHNPEIEYHHLIVDYHFGFAKRAFIGALVSFALPVVPVWFVYALGAAIWALALLLFLRLFGRTFGFDAATAPLFAFVFGSPFFLKNFMQTIGYFDIYGCVLALIMLLIPARSFVYVIAGALGCVVLILIHPVHMLLYVPTVGMIVVMRHYFLHGAPTFSIAAGIILMMILAAVFILSIFYGAVPVPVEQLIAHLHERAPAGASIMPRTVEMWYRPIGDDIARTWNVLPENLLRLPLYAALIALHWPLIRYFKEMMSALANVWHRRLTLLGIAGITLGYLIIAVVVFDYSRWVSSWAVCMFLIMHAVKMLPGGRAVPLIADDKRNRALGWLVTAIPRVGITKPF